MFYTSSQNNLSPVSPVISDEDHQATVASFLVLWTRELFSLGNVLFLMAQLRGLWTQSGSAELTEGELQEGDGGG